MAEQQGKRIPVRELMPDGPTGQIAAGLAEELPAAVVAPGRRVTLHFALQLASGEMVDSNFGGNPATCIIGDGSLLPGFEQVLHGLEAGAERNFVIPPEGAFGTVNDDNIQRFPRYQFAPDLPLAIGLMVEFADAAGNAQAGVVKRIGGSHVDVDFNHPLAGRSILFSVHVLEVGPGTAQ